MATIDDFGGPNDSLNSPKFGGPGGWAAAVRDEIRELQGRPLMALEKGEVATGDADFELTETEAGGYRLDMTLPAVGDGSIGVSALIPGAVGHYDVRAFGAVGDGVTDDTAAIQSAIDAAAARVAAGTLRAAVYFPEGVYLTDRFGVPGRVSLHGDGNATLRTRETDGGHFCVFTGSFSTAEGLTFDGQRGAQSGAPIGLSTVLFTRLNAPTGGGMSLSGGVTLSAEVSAGASSIAVSDDSPGGEQIVAGEYISLVESSKYELVRVAPGYTGGLTIPIETATVESFTTAAKVSVASTDVTIRQCRVLGNGRDGIAFWHAIRGRAYHNVVEDFEDSGIDFPDAGSRWCEAVGNHIETRGRWGIAFDTASSDFGPVADCVSHSNIIRFLSGGSFVNGNTLDGIYMGVTKRCKSINDTFDLTLAGRSGVFMLTGTVDGSVEGMTVTGPDTPRAGTAGVFCSGAPTRPTVSGGHVAGVHTGVNLDQTVHARVVGVQAINCSAYGVSTTAGGAAQRIAVIGVHADGNVMGVRFGGTPAAGNAVSVSGCVLINSSYQACGADGGWNLTQTGNV